MKLTAINKFPVKSLKGVSLSSAVVDDFGIKNDRRWMLVDEDGTFISQRKHPVMGTIGVQDADGLLAFKSSCNQELSVSPNDFTETCSVKVWGDEVSVLAAHSEVGDWFSGILNKKVRLVYMPDRSFRQVDREYADYNQRVSFADGFPFLLISEASLNDLNTRLDNPVGMSRFRPNLVVSGCDAYEEDRWKKIRVGGIEFDVVKPCSRCIMTTIDENTLKHGKEPLKTLAGYRRNEYGVCFGQNLVHRGEGHLTVGDSIEVLERQS
ncbi:MOSC domain-containing protein [Alkalimarinus coralli]|uniref:MOSC domain-containing protein n=1 Tax=Alkalimarinus coralli TaxID=2935863 RepID=UPI00202B20B2|nr:MOSC domain-containing protein [Alkalimarinus coralli]